jgi:hypothetical protein
MKNTDLLSFTLDLLSSVLRSHLIHMCFQAVKNTTSKFNSKTQKKAKVGLLSALNNHWDTRNPQFIVQLKRLRSMKKWREKLGSAENVPVHHKTTP